METIFRIGLVSTAHGIKGAIRVFPTTQDPKRFKTLKEVRFSTTGEAEEICAIYRVQSVAFSKNQVLLQLEGVTDRNQAEAMRGGSLWVDRENAVALDEDEFYFADFIGATVVEDNGTVVGTVAEIFETGSNDVIAVKEVNGNELLLPVIRECVLSMDAEKALITVHMMEGLR